MAHQEIRQTVSGGHRRDALVVTLLALVVLGAFWRVTLLRRALYYFDVTELNLPLRHFYGHWLARGHLPLWAKNLYGGFPILAEGQAGPLYPPNLALFPWMPSWAAYNLCTVGHMAALAAFTYLFLRRLAGRAGAATGALAFTFSAFVVQHQLHMSVFNQTVWLPLLFWVIDRAYASRQARWLLAGSAAVAIQLLAGHHQVAVMTWAAAAAYGAVLWLGGAAKRRWATQARSVVVSLAVVFGLGLALAAVQVVPTFELLGQSVRSSGLAAEEAAWGSWPPCLAATFFWPSGSRGSCGETSSSGSGCWLARRARSAWPNDARGETPRRPA